MIRMIMTVLIIAIITVLIIASITTPIRIRARIAMNLITNES